MTGRAVQVWRGRKADSRPPPRVRLRVFERYGGRCAFCTRKLGTGGERWQVDHVVALVNGGENAEDNLQPLCEPCHRAKTGEDVEAKARAYRKRQRSAEPRAGKGRPLPGSRGTPWKRTIDGRTVRRDERD